MPDRYEQMLFDYETSNRTDYHDGEILPIVKTVARKKPARPTNLKPPPLKDLHTLSVWKTPNVPFDLLIRAKDITRTNPWKVQQRYVSYVQPFSSYTIFFIIYKPLRCPNRSSEQVQGIKTCFHDF